MRLNRSFISNRDGVLLRRCLRFVILKARRDDDGFLRVSAMNRLAVVAQCGLRKAFWHPDYFCPFRPCVAIAMERDANHARFVTAAAKPARPVVGRELGQVREQCARGGQVAQDRFQCVAKGELRQ